MTLALLALLAVNAMLHAAIPLRHGLAGNAPPALFGALYLALAIAIWLPWPLAHWAVLAVVLTGTAGLVANYRRLGHEPTFERMILAVNPVILLVAGYLVTVG